jgi:hypothetical protein
MRIRILAAAVAALVVASCDRPAAPGTEAGATATAAASGFNHGMTADLSGYYMPLTEVRAGKWSLDHVFVGQTAEFQSWEAGTRSPTFAPVMLQFDDVTSPMVANEIGESRSITVRVLPTSYSVTDTSIAFEGRSPELGAVAFEGNLQSARQHSGLLRWSRRSLPCSPPRRCH